MSAAWLALCFTLHTCCCSVSWISRYKYIWEQGGVEIWWRGGGPILRPAFTSNTQGGKKERREDGPFSKLMLPVILMSHWQKGLNHQLNLWIVSADAMIIHGLGQLGITNQIQFLDSKRLGALIQSPDCWFRWHMDKAICDLAIHGELCYLNQL